ncbi:helix-turn-helix domain-containing protein [Lysobacter sp. F6437]|uniref:helix-turn-helix domain-containing protein n=1 Tax=Lysobacter sp. F6437 TaxID=3459296 RepID=UPI00403DADE7
MKIGAELTDLAVLQALGERLAARRIAMGMTQAEAAEQAGVSKRTLERLEAGDAVQSPNLVRVLRVLQLLDGLEALLPSAGPGPMDVLRREGKTRQRAPRAGVGEPAGQPWRWGDES